MEHPKEYSDTLGDSDGGLDGASKYPFKSAPTLF